MGRSTSKSSALLEIGADHLLLEEAENADEATLERKICFPEDDRLFFLAAALRRGQTIEQLHAKTKIDLFFLYKLSKTIELENRIKENPQNQEILAEAKRAGFSDAFLATCWNVDEQAIYDLRKAQNLFPVYKMVDTCAAEFESTTPYFYSTYEEENESTRSAKESVIVLGSGPIRIGQGVEFDYATVHSVWAIQQAGYEAIIINNNPETVSTDFSISDKLYFEPLTLEDVMHVIEIEQPLGVVVQFGGQTAINLADGLAKRGVKILGTSLEDTDRAENRDAFEKALEILQIPQPAGKTATSVEEAINVATDIGYPVLVRPSYVLGGRAMEIVESEEALKHYMTNAVKVNPKHPVLVDRYVSGQEVEVDAISDGENVLIPGIMEHIERAGVHSGDSIAVYPAQRLSSQVKNTIVDYTTRLATGLNIIGMLNIQYVVDGEEVFVIEVNPRSSRTAPFLSKITEIPMANVATRVILGENLIDLGYTPGLAPEKQEIFVKVPVFSFAKLRSVDTSLGPEMKSTGEVMGKDVTLEKALYKGFVASGTTMHDYGTVLLTVADRDKEEAVELAKRFNRIGFTIMATKGTASTLEEANIPVSQVKKSEKTKKR